MPRPSEPPSAQVVVRAYPRAARDRLGPMVEGVLQVRVTPPPADGQANAAIRRLLAAGLGVPLTTLRLVAGVRSRDKRFAVDGLDATELRRRLRSIGRAD